MIDITLNSMWKISDNSNGMTTQQLQGVKHDLAEAARTVRDTEEYAAMLQAMPTLPKYGEQIGQHCAKVAQLLLAVLPTGKNAESVRALTRHAARTRDAKELQRITEQLATKGTLA